MCKCEMMCREDVGDIMGSEYMDVTAVYSDPGEAVTSPTPSLGKRAMCCLAYHVLFVVVRI